MKIAIFEISTSNHAVMIYNWVEICKVNKWELEVFTTKEIYQQISMDITIRDEQLHIIKTVTLIEIIKASIKLANSNIIVITSLQSYFFHYLPLLFLRSKFLLTIHNINTWFVGRNYSSPKSTLKHIVRDLWLKKSDALILNSSNMKKHLDKNECSSKLTTIVPFSLRQREACELNEAKKGSTLNIVYPGMVSKKRKSYKDFLHLAETFPNINFTLLGRLILNEGGDEIEDDINRRQLNNVTYYKSYVEQEEFNRVMCTANVLFSVINVNYNHQGITEIYGKSKDSGISYLMAEFGLPLIVNDDFSNLDCLKEGTLYYKNLTDLEQIINQILEKNSFLESKAHKVLTGRQALNIKSVAKSVSSLIGKV